MVRVGDHISGRIVVRPLNDDPRRARHLARDANRPTSWSKRAAKARRSRLRCAGLSPDGTMTIVTATGARTFQNSIDDHGGAPSPCVSLSADKPLAGGGPRPRRARRDIALGLLSLCRRVGCAVCGAPAVQADGDDRLIAEWRADYPVAARASVFGDNAACVCSHDRLEARGFVDGKWLPSSMSGSASSTARRAASPVFCRVALVPSAAPRGPRYRRPASPWSARGPAL